MDIETSIKESDIEIFSVLRAVMDFKSQQKTLIQGKEPQLSFSLDVRYADTNESIRDSLSRKERIIINAMKNLGSLHPLEKELIIEKFHSIIDKFRIIRLSGTKEACKLASEILGINTTTIEKHYQQLVPKVMNYIESPKTIQPVYIDSTRITKEQLKELIIELGQAYKIDMQSKIIISDEAPNCYYDPIIKKIFLPSDDEYYKNKENTILKLCYTMTAPHEFFHFLYSQNGLMQPSKILSHILSLGTKGYFTIEEGRVKSQQIQRLKTLSTESPQILPEDNMQKYLYTKELKASAMHFIAYKMRQKGNKDLEIFQKLKKYSPKQTAASTTLRSRLGMPKTDYPFPGYLIYYAGLKQYEELTDEVKLKLENGKMNISKITTGKYDEWIKAGLATKVPKKRYDKNFVLKTINNFVDKIRSQNI